MMRSIEEMTEQQAKALLHTVADIFSIGASARTQVTILTNIKNAARRSNCLFLIEKYHTIIVADDDGEECEESRLNWGEEPEQYIATYKAMKPNTR